MLTQIINGHILTPQGWLKDGSVLISDGKILEVTNSDLAVIGATVIDAKGMYIVPGFVSMHAHGGAGHDFTEGTTEAFQKATQAHLAHGATSIFPTLSSTSFDNIKRAVTTCEELMKKSQTRKNTFPCWKAHSASSAGTSARNSPEDMTSQDILAPKVF